MKTQSRKAKGRRLQNLVAKKILKTFKHLKKEDVQVAIMSERGPDIKLSRIAKRLVPLQIECKNQQKMKTVYDFYSQATGPLLSIATLFIIFQKTINF